MNILKHIQFLVFVLFPACLMGMEQGSWIEQDKLGKDVVIEWRKITDYQKLLESEKALIPVMAEAFAYQVEETDKFEEQVALVTEYIKKQNEAAMSKYLQRQKVKIFTSFVVTVKDAGTDKVLGFTMFHSKPKFQQGCVILEPLAIIPTAQGRGLSRFLVFSIFRLMPEANQIDLFVRHESTKAQAIYNILGFRVSEKKEHGMVLKYIKK